jgi:hypothetical protein
MKKDTLSKRVSRSGGLRPALFEVDKHITELLHYCVDYIEANKISADKSDIDALRKTFYGKTIGELSEMTPNCVNLITEAYFRGKGTIE